MAAALRSPAGGVETLRRSRSPPALAGSSHGERLQQPGAGGEGARKAGSGCLEARGPD
jgi:hypothetical protein